MPHPGDQGEAIRISDAAEMLRPRGRGVLASQDSLSCVRQSWLPGLLLHGRSGFMAMRWLGLRGSGERLPASAETGGISCYMAFTLSVRLFPPGMPRRAGMHGEAVLIAAVGLPRVRGDEINA